MGRIVKRRPLGVRHSGYGLQQLGFVLAIVGLALGGGEAPGEAVGAVTVLVWILVLIAVLVPRGADDRLARITRAHLIATLLLAGLLAVTALSLGWGSDDGAGFAEAVLLAGYLGTFVLAGLTFGRGRGGALCTAVGAAVLAVAVISLGARLLGLGGGDAALAELLPPASGRLSYPIGYWNALGALMALGIPVFVSLAARSRAPLTVGLWVAATTPTLLTAYMTSSRGALLAALIGVGVAIGLADDGPRTAATFALSVLAALPAIVTASVADGILSTSGTGAPGSAELAVIVALLLGVGGAVGLAAPAIGRLCRLRFPMRSRPSRLVLTSILAVIAAGLVVLTGPGRLVDNFSSLPVGPKTEAATGILSASGSGRAQFWGVALEAFADAPLEGVGAGGFASYWNRNGSLGTPARNAHSEPFELLAEVGLIGFLCFFAFAGVVVAAAVRHVRSARDGGADAGMAAGVLAAGSVGFAIDWTWQVPAVTVPILAVAAALAASAFLPARGSLARMPATEQVGLPSSLAAGALVLVAAASIWAGGVLGIASAKLSESENALAGGDPNGAARAAREAAAIQPWAAEPWLQLARVEYTVDNLEAARLATQEAVERAPEDFRPWLLASVVQGELGNGAASVSYAFRAVQLAPLVLQRLPEFVPSLQRSGA